MGGFPALSAVSASGYTEVVKYLLEKGVDSSHKDKDGKTALDVAMEFRYGEAAKHIRIAINSKCAQTSSPLDWVSGKMSKWEALRQTEHVFRALLQRAFNGAL